MGRRLREYQRRRGIRRNEEYKRRERPEKDSENEPDPGFTPGQRVGGRLARWSRNNR